MITVFSITCLVAVLLSILVEQVVYYKDLSFVGHWMFAIALSTILIFYLFWRALILSDSSLQLATLPGPNELGLRITIIALATILTTLIIALCASGISTTFRSTELRPVLILRLVPALLVLVFFAWVAYDTTLDLMAFLHPSLP